MANTIASIWIRAGRHPRRGGARTPHSLTSAGGAQRNRSVRLFRQLRRLTWCLGALKWWSAAARRSTRFAVRPDFDDYDSPFENIRPAAEGPRQRASIGPTPPPRNRPGVYRPVQTLPIWVGVGGTPKSFARAGALGLPLMVAIIGGEPRRFKPLIDLYRETGAKFGHAADRLKVGVHSLGYVANTKKEAADDYYPGYASAIESVAKERGWPSATRERFDAQLGPEGALLIGEASEVADKILHHSETLGGIARVTFQMNAASLPQKKMLRAIETIGARVAPVLHGGDMNRFQEHAICLNRPTAITHSRTTPSISFSEPRGRTTPGFRSQSATTC